MAEIFALKPEDESRIHPRARKYFNEWRAKILREVPQLEQLHISEKVGGIVKNELAEPRSQQKPPSLEDEIKRKGSKKARAFQLFSEGKRPGDAKVKSLGIKPSTAYRYYQHWKKAH